MGDEIRDGWSHFAAADWAGARDAFAAALVAEPGDPEALDGLGQSLWWLGQREAAIESRREAYAAFRRQGDRSLRRVWRSTSPASIASTASPRPAPGGWRGRAGCSPTRGPFPSSGCS